ncbi:uncharacterized protein LOC112561431 [Pomacea canaliculata]|uniref:uncharacterized protein LOC112561431 n=1 Tax=Pomacea canaliculata TaxID=400727 RepID=UPI000D72E768|nr:uncharacterized protein LOC112561431 [Pomacea canaliculata]
MAESRLSQNKSSLDSSGVTVSAPKGPNSVSSPKSPAAASMSRGCRPVCEGVESSLSPGTHLDRETGEATIDAKVFVCLLNEEFLRSKTCRHQVALAYLSDSAIFPLILKPRESLLALVDPDLKLLLASYKWRSLSEGGVADNDISMITDDIKALLDSLQVLPLGGDNGPVDENSSQQAAQDVSSEGEKHQLKKHSSIRFRQQNIVVEDDQCRQMKAGGVLDNSIWRHRPRGLDAVKHVHKDHLTRFCCVDGEVVALWSRMEEKVREKFALKEVFCVESTVRVAAMRNVDKFCSPGVVDGLRDLLSDPEYSTRAAAAISLARVKADDLLTMSHIVRMLSDEDRLIREVGCLALGRLKSRLALKKLMYMWRNDAISNVREAACWALHQIGGQEVEDIFRVIKDLEHELRMLRDATT